MGIKLLRNGGYGGEQLPSVCLSVVTRQRGQIVASQPASSQPVVSCQLRICWADIKSSPTINMFSSIRAKFHGSAGGRIENFPSPTKRIYVCTVQFSIPFGLMIFMVVHSLFRCYRFRFSVETYSYIYIIIHHIKHVVMTHNNRKAAKLVWWNSAAYTNTIARAIVQIPYSAMTKL